MRGISKLTTVTGRVLHVNHDLTIDPRGQVKGTLTSPEITQADVTHGPNDRLTLLLDDGRNLILVCKTQRPMTGEFDVVGHVDGPPSQGLR